MADLFEALFAKLGGESTVTAVVGTNPKRIFPETIPQAAVMPAICLREIDDTPSSGLNAMSGHGLARVEIGCAAATPKAARALRAIVRAVLDKYRGTSANFQIRDCVPTSQTTDAEQPIDGSQEWRYVANVEYEIGYQA